MQVPQLNPDMENYYNYTSPAMPDGVWIIYGVIENFFAATAVVVDVDFCCCCRCCCWYYVLESDWMKLNIH